MNPFSLLTISRITKVKSFFLLGICLVLLKTNIFAQGKINFEQKSWPEILRISKEQNKPIFVDAFTNWCGPCKKMVQDVFSDSTVGEFYNRNFINYSVNIETPEGKLFDSLFDIKAYPSLLYFEPNGDLIFREFGYKDIPRLIALGARAKSNQAFTSYTSKMRAGYENGTSDKHALYKYFLVLRDSGRAVDSVAAAIIRKLEPSDLNNDTAYAIWVDYDQRMNSPLLDYFLQQKQVIINRSSKDIFDHKLNMIVSENLVKAKSTNDLVAYGQLQDFIRRVYDGEEEEHVLAGADRKFNAGK